MNKTELCSLKILTACEEIGNVVNELKFIQSTLPLKDFIRINESLNKLEEHRTFLLSLQKQITGLG